MGLFLDERPQYHLVSYGTNQWHWQQNVAVWSAPFQGFGHSPVHYSQAILSNFLISLSLKSQHSVLAQSSFGCFLFPPLNS